MLDNLHWAKLTQHLRRSVDRFSVLGVAAVLLALSGGWETAEGVVQGKASPVSGLNSLAHNLSVVLDYGLVRFGLLLIGLVLVSRSSQRIIAADDARSLTERTAADARSEAERNSLQARAAEIKAHLDDLAGRLKNEMDQTQRLTALMARAYLLQDRLAGMQQPMLQAQHAVRDYEEYVDALDAGQPKDGARHLPMLLRRKLEATHQALNLAHHSIGGEPWRDGIDALLVNPEIERDMDRGTATFRVEQNGKFLHAHHEHKQRMKTVLESYRNEIGETARMLAETRHEIKRESETKNGKW